MKASKMITEPFFISFLLVVRYDYNVFDYNFGISGSKVCACTITVHSAARQPPFAQTRLEEYRVEKYRPNDLKLYSLLHYINIKIMFYKNHMKKHNYFL